jgi:hypothetical protein
MSFSMLLKHERRDDEKIEIVGECESLGASLCPRTIGTCPLRRIKDTIERNPDISTSQVWGLLHAEKDQRHVAITDFPDVPPFAVMVECLDQYASTRKPVRKGMLLIHYQS